MRTVVVVVELSWQEDKVDGGLMLDGDELVGAEAVDLAPPASVFLSHC